jgi:catechol 2,3-dioxygenase-like lactoylglutathione lyase family enzyme
MNAKLAAVHPVLGAPDVRASERFFRRLGFTVTFEDAPNAPRYAAVVRDAVELHLQWTDASHDSASTSVDRPTYRFLVDDVDALYAEFVAGGGVDRSRPPSSPWAAPANTPWGTREFHVRDPAGNGLQFYRSLHAHELNEEHRA